MMGFFDVNKNQYPWLPTNIGNDIAVHNVNTGEIDLREPVAGEYKSAERNAQNARFEARAIELSNEHRRNADYAPTPKAMAF